MFRSLKKPFKKMIVDMFHRMYYENDNTWPKNTFLGYSILQCPMDLHLYQELIYRLKPAFIVQTGVSGGGSILYFATLLDLIRAPKSAVVIGIDIVLDKRVKGLSSHPRIRLIEGSSTDPKTLEKVKKLLPAKTGMVILDSDHSKTHVLNEMKLYRQFVGKGSYMVVEDTNINGNPVHKTFGPGPMEAVQAYLEENDDFQDDEAFWRKTLFSHHQYGWLKRVK